MVGDGYVRHRFSSSQSFCFPASEADRRGTDGGMKPPLSGQSFDGVLQAWKVGYVNNLRILVYAFHEPAEGRARAQLDEPREALREQPAHGFLPSDRGRALL